MRRPSLPQIFMDLAVSLEARSTCSAGPAGAVIVTADFRKVLAIGYRGNAAGLANRCDRPGPDCGCLHAEENAIIGCDGSRGDPKVLLASQVPCPLCAKRLINLGGVVDVYLPHEPHEEQTRELFHQAGIRVQTLVTQPPTVDEG